MPIDMRTTALFILTPALLGACSGDKDEDSGDTGAAEAPWFTEAVLDPPFEHGNAIWSGVALLDFDVIGTARCAWQRLLLFHMPTGPVLF